LTPEQQADAAKRAGSLFDMYVKNAEDAETESSQRVLKRAVEKAALRTSAAKTAQD
jgi:hypothetical protein